MNQTIKFLNAFIEYLRTVSLTVPDDALSRPQDGSQQIYSQLNFSWYFIKYKIDLNLLLHLLFVQTVLINCKHACVHQQTRSDDILIWFVFYFDSFLFALSVWTLQHNYLEAM